MRGQPTNCHCYRVGQVSTRQNQNPTTTQDILVYTRWNWPESGKRDFERMQQIDLGRQTSPAKRRPREKMISAQRRALILDIIHDHGGASIQQLSDRLGASFSTMRRDLDYLAKRGLILRTHGGATLLSSERPVAEEPSDAQPETVNRGKVAIGAEAAKRIDAGQSIIFDANLTVLEAALHVVEQRLRVTAVTNGLKIAAVLARAPQVRLIVLGGTLRTGSFSLMGEPGASFLGRLHTDVALIGAQSVSDDMLTDSHVEMANLKQAMIRSARRKILLIDSWKFGGPGFCNVARMSEFDEVITDDGLPAATCENLEKLGVSLTVVSAGDHDSQQWTSTSADTRKPMSSGSDDD